jgi:tetratricopeptide (TPR) repeat protein
MRINLGIVFSLVALIASGCATFSDTREFLNEQTSEIKKTKELKEDKLVYSTEQRCYKYNDILLLKEQHQKIRNKEEAIEHIRFVFSYEEYTSGEKVAGGAALAWAAPVVIITEVAKNIALIPVMPYVYYLKHKYKKESFENYLKGMAFLEHGKYREARLHFKKAIKLATALIQSSDIYFKIAETYEGEHQQDLANKYYHLFLNYSIALYPEYFADYGQQYKNDLKRLEEEFSKAEEKIKSEKTVKTAL